MFTRNRKPVHLTGLFCWLVLLIFLTGCKSQETDTLPTLNPPTEYLPTLTPTLIPTRLLTVCMGQEPSSLFLYNDSSIAANTIRQAIYDGPIDVSNYQNVPVILENIPTLSNGGILFEPITVQQGDVIVDSDGNLMKLNDGISYFPTGCRDSSCISIFDALSPILMDQMVVRFKLLNGIQWSDGEQLTADDSVYSFEIVQALYPRALSELVTITQSYSALNETTTEWRGIAGYRGSVVGEKFFIPLPRHTWGILPPDELLSSDVANRSPMGWGPYIIDEWITGDHITLSQSSNYFRNPEGLPAFDKLVFRFVPNAEEALAALLAGECDYLDETTHLESNIAQLLNLQEEDRIKVAINEGAAWEHLDFGIFSLNTSLPAIFQQKEVRQAVAWCLDRQQMVDEVFSGNSLVADNYIPPGHPLFNPEIKRYTFDPPTGIKLLDSVGWLDNDGDSSTPRISQGVVGVPDGTSLEFTFLVTEEEEKVKVAQIMQKSLAQCGIKVNVNSIPSSEFYAPGPEGLVFGRNFSLAQFGWITPNNVGSGIIPPCILYTSREIPGPYPEYPKGWGGANIAGFSNPEFDQICQIANSALSEDQVYKTAYYQAQLIFTEDLPALPLYLRPKIVAMRSDICRDVLDLPGGIGLWDIETFGYSEGCN